MYAFAIGQCYTCKRTITFNPVKVPSIRINGVREPVCADCIARANPVRVSKGLPPIEILPDAYGSCDESEL